MSATELHIMLDRSLDPAPADGNGNLTHVNRKIHETAQARSNAENSLTPAISTEIILKHNSNNFLALALCHLYGIMIITLGILVSVTDPFYGSYNNTAPMLCLVLCCVGLVYLVYLMVDICVEEVRDKRLQRDSSPPLAVRGDRHYMFDLSKHATNFYLKLGAAGFALGHLVHTVLLLVVLQSLACRDPLQMSLDVCYLLYSALQLVFIFKYNNIIVLKHKVLARFGFTHFIATSITLWVWTIVRETWLALFTYQYESVKKLELSSQENRTSLSSVTTNETDCYGLSPTVEVVFKNLSPYLFPFSVEFNIIMGGFFLIIWINIGKYRVRSDADHNFDLTASLDFHENQLRKFTIFADCHASSRGLMLGFFVLVLTVVSLMISFIFASIDKDSQIGDRLNDYTKLGLNLVLLGAVVPAFWRTRALDYIQHRVSGVDDFLLLVCVPGFFLDSVLTMVATASFVNVVKFIDSIINVLQVILQTGFLVDRMRRCSNSSQLRRSKPGRQLVMFLLIVNVTVWFFNTFSYKSADSKDERYAFYGKTLWTVLGHVTLPLIMFYRFHSSVCFADIWQLAYESEH